MATAVSRSPAARRALAVHKRLMRFGQAESIVAPAWVEPDSTVRAVEAHLANLWSSRPEPDDATVTEKGMPHARASVLNLIVMVPDEKAATRVVATMVGLGVRHPSRAIVLSADAKASGPTTCSSSVATSCMPPATRN